LNEDVVKKWIKKAESDLKIGLGEMESENPATDAICFHMQQCVEKYLKAFLIFKNQEIVKTHDIALLLKKCVELDEEFMILFEKEIDILTDYAIEIRYPDDFYFPSIEETKKAIEKAKDVKNFVLSKLNWIQDESLS